MISEDHVVVRSGLLGLELAPSYGGRAARLTCDAVDVLAPLIGRFSPPFWPRAGAYPMVPYHNRIEEGRLQFEGKALRLPPHPDSAPHKLHGSIHLERWSVVPSSEQAVTIPRDRTADDAWPWALQAEQVFTLTDEESSLGLAVKNLSDQGGPAGLGWPTYMACCRAIRHDSEYEWPMCKDYQPTGERRVLGKGFDGDVDATLRFSCWSTLEAETAAGPVISISTSPLP